MDGVAITNRGEETIRKISDVSAAYTEQFYWKYEELLWDARSLSPSELELLIDMYIEDPDDYDYYEGYAKPGFFPHLSRYISSDWNSFAGSEDRDILTGIDFCDFGSIESRASIAMFCIDGAFWEVFSVNSEVLDELTREFGVVRRCRLSEKLF